MSTIKQVILYRRDLNMRKGKIAAQAAHASMAVFFNRRVTFRGFRQIKRPTPGTVYGDSVGHGLPGPHLLVPLTPEMEEWVEGLFTKVVLSVENEADLLTAYEAAKAQGLPAALITDAGKTEFHGQPTHTTIAIGPASADDIDKITGPGGLVKTKLA